MAPLMFRKPQRVLHNHFHLISRCPNDKIFENHIECCDDLSQNK